MGVPGRVSDVEQTFLDALAANPDDEARAVYTDWLEERADPRAEYLRREAEVHALGTTANALDLHELAALAKPLDPAWLAIVTRVNAARVRVDTVNRAELPLGPSAPVRRRTETRARRGGGGDAPLPPVPAPLEPIPFRNPVGALFGTVRETLSPGEGRVRRWAYMLFIMVAAILLAEPWKWTLHSVLQRVIEDQAPKMSRPP